MTDNPPLRVYPDLDDLQPHDLKRRLEAGLYPDKDKQKYAQYLLERKEREQTDIARSAKDAAWESANAAKGANRRATIAIFISIISALVGAAGLVVAIIALK